VQDPHQVGEYCFPYAELKFVKKVYHEKIVVFEAEVVELGREGILEISGSIGN
jgi:hypothetical protein